MTYSISCECGNRLDVDPALAGTDVVCACGASLAVPSLSRLRQSVGKGAYEAGTIDTINRMIHNGELPQGDTCAISGWPTLDCYEFYVQCETSWIKKGSRGSDAVGSSIVFSVFAWSLLPLNAMAWLLGGSQRNNVNEIPLEMGRDRGVAVPLRVREEHHPRLRNIRSQRKLRNLLRTVPIYAKLLDEYPTAKIQT